MPSVMTAVSYPVGLCMTPASLSRGMLLLLMLLSTRSHGDLSDGKLAWLRGEPADRLRLLRRDHCVLSLAAL